ncbi:MAG: hypothetical protein GWO87_00900 [Xanthomonadaceae bacterium]|nr:hypothetical protein [Rhodospirillaceae bacterium]NIA17732.1 hypothetical protein [Xanthomonadaceae bacterium]
MTNKVKIELNLNEIKELERTLHNELSDPLVETNIALIKSVLLKLKNTIKNNPFFI